MASRRVKLLLMAAIALAIDRRKHLMGQFGLAAAAGDGLVYFLHIAAQS
jgi:hypothetical protein